MKWLLALGLVIPGALLAQMQPPFTFDGSSYLQVNCTVGCSASSGPAFGGAFPSTGNAVGFKDNSGNLAGGNLDSGGNLKVDCASGCSGAADTTATGNLTAAGSTLSVAMAGVNSVSFTLPSGNNLVGTITPEFSSDGGTTWTATYLRSSQAGSFWTGTLSVSSTAGTYNILVPGGAGSVRIRLSSYTSGAAAGVAMRAAGQPEALFSWVGTAGSAAPPYLAQMAGTDGSNLRGFLTDSSGRLYVNVNGTLPVSQSGAWTVQPGNTANTTPWLMTISQGGNAATVTGANALKVDGSAVTQPVSGTVSVNALPAGSNTIGAVTQASGPWTQNLTQVNGNAVATAASGVQKVGITGNAGAAVDQAPGSAAPANAVQVAGTDGTNSRVQYLDPCAFQSWSYYPINVSANTQIAAGSTGKNVYLCQMFLAPVTAAANVNLVEGTGTTCGTGTAGMLGGATAALGAQLSANGGFVLPFQSRAWAKTATSGDALCIFASAQVTGVLAYVQF